ncbi:MAG: magnesium transporter [Proteobacteria bacterium]|jgi:magnesium transporter|nr:magnesium transporter [Pseudomonadota bacterium]MDC0375922.1 magnesium transporter [Pelagibacteraceae bacterium]
MENNSEIKTKKIEFNLSSSFLQELINKIEAKDLFSVNDLLSKLHPSDIAEVISNLPEKNRFELIALENFKINPHVIVELTDELQKEILEKISSDRIVKIINSLESDNALQIIENLEDNKKEKVLTKIPIEDKNLFEETLSTYPENSAARIMQREFAAVPEDWTVGQTIDYLRETSELPKEFLEIFIINQLNIPIGSVPSSRVLRTPRDVKMNSIMKNNKFLIPAEMDQEQVAYNFEQYNLFSAGVVDQNQKLIGMITVDDIVTVIKEEAEEDTLRLAGVSDEEISDSAFSITKKRFIWLTINLLTAILASTVISLFNASIEKVVALAILMPIVASMGGNAGTQTLTVTVRLLATKELISSNVNKIVSKEFLVGFYNGLIFAVITGLAIFVWFKDYHLSLLIAVAMIINMTAAGFFGIFIPVILNKFKIDPAISSSVFVTTITDVFGFLSFLGLASYILQI